MQDVRLVAVSEDGSYAILAVPGRSGRFALPIDDRLRTVARGRFSRLAQYEIEVENPLRPKEIQDRIRAGETAEEIADAAGVPVEKVRRFEGPPLAERARWAVEAQRASVRDADDPGPGRRLGDIVLERLRHAGAADGDWDSSRRPDGTWHVRLGFEIAGHARTAAWLYDPRRRQATPLDDEAVQLCLPESQWPAARFAGRGTAAGTVTSITPRLGAHHTDSGNWRESDTEPASPSVTGDNIADPEQIPGARGVNETSSHPAAEVPGESDDDDARRADLSPPPGRSGRRAAGGRSRRASVPSWDEIMFGTSRPQD